MATTFSDLQVKPHAPVQLDNPTMTRRTLDTSPSLSPVRSISSISRVHTPSSSVPDTPLLPTRPSSPEKNILRSSDPSNFLTALAAQERRVLELKEELQKAESQLEKLKEQWAAHEAVKKRNELRRSEQLQMLKISLATPCRQEEPTQATRGLHRGKLGLSHSRSSQRKVFSGSRHTRALSLLSPKDSSLQSKLTANNKHDDSVGQQRTEIGVPPTISEKARPQSTYRPPEEYHISTDKDAILETGKQIVGDFRQGLWTFFEDLRQVTVGEEAPNASKRATNHSMGHRARKPSKNQANPAEEKVNINSTHAIALDVAHMQYINGAAPLETSGLLRRAQKEDTQGPDGNTPETRLVDPDCSVSEEGWDNWDSCDNFQNAKPTVAEQRDSKPTNSPLTESSSPHSCIG